MTGKKAAFYWIMPLFLLLGGCHERRTKNPVVAYRLWSGQAPAKEIELIHGNYWESSHWSKEYVLYLHLKAPTIWINEFIVQNKLRQAEKVKIISDDIPDWFRPSDQSKVFVSADEMNDSVYYYDSLHHEFMIYELQL